MKRPSTAKAAPDQRIRDLRREFTALGKEPAGPQRAARLATFARAAHEDRQLNMAMHTASLCLEDDPDDPRLLVAAYTGIAGTPPERLHALADLRDLGRYLGRPDIASLASTALRELATAWAADATDGERRYRLRTIQSVADRDLADRIRDQLDGR